MRILLDENQLQAGVERLATEIDRFYGAKRPLTVIAVMTGSLVLFADLIRRLSMPQRVGVIQASSYRGGTESGTLEVNANMMIDVKDRDVLLVDDIFDTGRTLDRLSGLIKELGAKSTKTAVLLHKHRQHAVSLRPDFVAFEIPDEFVVGYGLDYLDMYRNLPYLAVLEVDEIEGGYRFSVSDNGVGFDLSSVKKGNGLDNMRARAESIEARLEISSSPPNGTGISVELRMADSSHTRT